MYVKVFVLSKYILIYVCVCVFIYIYIYLCINTYILFIYLCLICMCVCTRAYTVSANTVSGQVLAPPPQYPIRIHVKPLFIECL